MQTWEEDRIETHTMGRWYWWHRPEDRNRTN